MLDRLRELILGTFLEGDPAIDHLLAGAVGNLERLAAAEDVLEDADDDVVVEVGGGGGALVVVELGVERHQRSGDRIGQCRPRQGSSVARRHLGSLKSAHMVSP